MRNNSLGGVRGALAAAVIAVGCSAVGWLAVRTTAVEVLPAIQPGLASIAPHDPDRVLDAEMVAFVLKRGRLDDGDFAAIAGAARAAPLDSRPYMFAATRHLMSGDKQPILPILEAGRRLDPRQRWIRLYLLDQYLRTRSYAKAMTEFAVLSRLVGDAGGPIVAELVRMSTDPTTSGAVREMFARNPELETEVLTQLAKSGASPAQIFAVVSPAARAAAGKRDGWGAVMVAAMADKGQYAQARNVWQMIYRVPPGAQAVPYDGDFAGSPGSPPFNWSLTASDVGAADRADGGLTISYYGRQLGKLAEQLLTLAPGHYRLSFTVVGQPPSNGGPTLSWNVACDKKESPLLLDGSIPPASPNPRRAAMAFTVPDNCPAQWLRITGTPGQFPGAMTGTIQHVVVQPMDAKS